MLPVTSNDLLEAELSSKNIFLPHEIDGHASCVTKIILDWAGHADLQKSEELVNRYYTKEKMPNDEYGVLYLLNMLKGKTVIMSESLAKIGSSNFLALINQDKNCINYFDFLLGKVYEKLVKGYPFIANKIEVLFKDLIVKNKSLYSEEDKNNLARPLHRYYFFRAVWKHGHNRVFVLDLRGTRRLSKYRSCNFKNLEKVILDQSIRSIRQLPNRLIKEANHVYYLGDDVEAFQYIVSKLRFGSISDFNQYLETCINMSRTKNFMIPLHQIMKNLLSVISVNKIYVAYPYGIDELLTKAPLQTYSFSEEDKRIFDPILEVINLWDNEVKELLQVIFNDYYHRGALTQYKKSQIHRINDLTVRGMMLSSIGLYNKALQIFNQALLLDIHNIELIKRRNNILAVVNFTRPESCWNSHAILTPRCDHVFNALQQYDEAVLEKIYRMLASAQYNDRYMAEKNNSIELNNQAMLELKKGDTNTALSLIINADLKQPMDPIILINYYIILTRLSDTVAAERIYDCLQSIEDISPGLQDHITKNPNIDSISENCHAEMQCNFS